MALEGWRLQIRFLDPSPFPWNPLRRKHSLYAGLDPVRAFRLAGMQKGFDGIVAVGESSVLLYLWVRTILGGGRPVCLYDPPLEYGWKIRAFVLDQVLRRCEAVLVRGENQRRFLHERYGRRLQVEVVWHAIDTDYWQPSGRSPGDYIFSIGNDPGRDFDTLLEALDGLNMPTIIKTSDHRLERAKGMPHVRVVRERIPFDALRELYDGARLVVIPLKESIHAGGVNSVLEAMAMGKALIVSRSSGIADYYSPGRSALEVPVGDSRALRRAIRELIHDDARSSELGRRARQEVVERFSRPVFDRRFFAALLRIFAGCAADTW
jgi:glycosyltransferase involved in cell wall biosynthesis